MIKKLFSFVLACLSCAMLFSGCSVAAFEDWVDRAKTNIIANWDLDYDKYELVEKNYTQLTFDGATYSITSEYVPYSSLSQPSGMVYLGDKGCPEVVFDANTGDEINKEQLMQIELLPGDLSKQKRVVLRYGMVYSLDGGSKEIAVEVNGRYRKATQDE